MSRRGLPSGTRMRHDSHYVEELAGQRPLPVGRLIPVELIDPNPEQPRVEFGDLAELVASVREKGVLEPLLVKREAGSGRWMIIAGERRWRAARTAGLREVPCVELDVDRNEVAEIALIENMQRKDLTAWEEADGLLALCHKFGYTHEDVAKRVGKSRTSITESLSIAQIPETIREKCRGADIQSKSQLLQVVRQPDTESMLEFIDRMSKRNSGPPVPREGVGRVRDEGDSSLRGGSFRGRRFSYSLPDRSVRLELSFRRGGVTREDVLSALRNILEGLESLEVCAAESELPQGPRQDAE